MAAIVIPIVALPALALLIVPVMWASRDPSGKGGGHPSRRAVGGGTFRGDPRRPAPDRDAWFFRDSVSGRQIDCAPGGLRRSRG